MPYPNNPIHPPIHPATLNHNPKKSKIKNQSSKPQNPTLKIKNPTLKIILIPISMSIFVSKI